MGFVDKRTEFGDAFDVTETTGTYLFTNQIDLGAAGRDPGNGQPVYLVISVDTEVDSSMDGATIQFRLASDDSASIHATTSTEHLLTEVFAEGNLAAGATYIYTLPVEGLAYERYLGLQAIIGGETVTGGAISAYLTLDPVGAFKNHPGATGLANSA